MRLVAIGAENRDLGWIGVGTGLGLSVSYFIITENHGGRLDVLSEPGQGANFVICLPVARAGGDL